ncbi:unnamed protein product [Musa banksii]
MRSVEERKPSRSLRPAQSKLSILLLLVSTNLLSVYLFSGGMCPIIGDTDVLLRELKSTKSELAQLQRFMETLFRGHGDKAASDDMDGWPDELPREMKLVVGPHKLPLGYNRNLGTDKLFQPLGSACRRFREELAGYMTYEVGGECPSDEVFAQRLMLKGCEPLPRRRCHPKSPKGYVEPAPLPESLWATPPDTSVVWDAYTCKNYSCLVKRGRSDKSYDCNDCFDLKGREKSRWLVDSSGGVLDFSIDSVLATRPAGTVRIGLDIGGGSGTFAARMRERDVTVVSSTMNFDGPFNSFIASRGLVPLHISVAHRLPFFDNTLDVVHSMHVLSNWMPEATLELALFDIYRVLRPGGLFWLDHFFCAGEQLNTTYVPMLARVGFHKLRWVTGRKLDRGIVKNEWYLSALLEKPMT